MNTILKTAVEIATKITFVDGKVIGQNYTILPTMGTEFLDVWIKTIEGKEFHFGYNMSNRGPFDWSKDNKGVRVRLLFVGRDRDFMKIEILS